MRKIDRAHLTRWTTALPEKGHVGIDVNELRAMAQELLVLRKRLHERENHISPKELVKLYK